MTWVTVKLVARLLTEDQKYKQLSFCTDLYEWGKKPTQISYN